jgi:uncharacterized protein YutE (UPF0331/DUF86 family)/predicted nucleotidyltransferase
MHESERLLDLLRALSEREPEIVLSFLFGSRATGRRTPDSDVDVAVYLRHAEEEDRIWAEIGLTSGAEVDLILLNSASASLVSAVFKTGIPLSIKDTELFWCLYLESTREAEDFAQFASDYWSIAQRSLSLTPEDRIRLIKRVQFLQEEWKDLRGFSAVTPGLFEASKARRREMERWAENMTNATIDIAKIVLASEKKPMPQSYQEALRSFALLAGMTTEEAERFSTLARLRNLLAHEYLDLLYGRIADFMNLFPPLYDQAFRFLTAFLKGAGSSETAGQGGTRLDS